MMRLATVKTTLEMASTVFVISAAAVLLWTQLGRPSDQQQTAAQQDVSGLTIAADTIRHSRGTAEIVLVEFTDYECPFCGQHARTTATTIGERLVSTNQLRHVVFNFPLERIHRNARKAGEAAECAGRQNLYWEMHSRLFENQGTLGAENLLRLADAIGAEPTTFGRCLNGEAAAAVSADQREGERLGVVSTPTFFVGVVQQDGSIRLSKRWIGITPFEEFQKVVASVKQTVSTRTQAASRN